MLLENFFASMIENIKFRVKALGGRVDDLVIPTKILATLSDQYKHPPNACDSTATTEMTSDNLTIRFFS